VWFQEPLDIRLEVIEKPMPFCGRNISLYVLVTEQTRLHRQTNMRHVLSFACQLCSQEPSKRWSRGDTLTSPPPIEDRTFSSCQTARSLDKPNISDKLNTKARKPSKRVRRHINTVVRSTYNNFRNCPHENGIFDQCLSGITNRRSRELLRLTPFGSQIFDLCFARQLLPGPCK